MSDRHRWQCYNNNRIKRGEGSITFEEYSHLRFLGVLRAGIKRRVQEEPSLRKERVEELRARLRDPQYWDEACGKIADDLLDGRMILDPPEMATGAVRTTGKPRPMGQASKLIQEKVHV